MILFSKVKAGALQFVLFIGTIIVLFLFAFILMNQSHSLLGKKTDIIVDLVQTSDKVLMKSLLKPMKTGENISMPDNDLGIQTKVFKEYWGLLEKRTVTSVKGKLRFQKTGLVGAIYQNRPALYIKDDNRPMVIVGDAKISGDAHLPERGIKMGNIQGYGYIGSQLVYGKILRSKNQLPKLHNEVLQRLKMLTSTAYMPKGNTVPLKRELLLKNSFQEETIVVQGTSIALENVSLTGNIVVWATDKIHVKSTSRLRDVILIAPTIEIEEGARGSFQAISGKEILVGKNCELDYPTILAVQGNTVSQEFVNKFREPRINIGKGTSISGSVLYCDKREPKGQPLFITIDQGAIVHGELYCEQSLELKGSVYGSVTTGSFVAFENGNTYLNHLFNGKIEAQRLPQEYCGLAYENKIANGVVKWLY
ncbi:hypothetical protein [Allomuricauda sp. F6463D]|uniref:hypothetical protein n=1 Tax=Allomuricauda sp. F6463D TaxID=2926409 RepID=UPI001FF58F32|nr:hypothetical protein [Muricauda sp. F6463D]MCK0160128.1 hypothetical protein [Muricauda sp. F6463D]